jgi:Protein of unknown function (DUF3302)
MLHVLWPFLWIWAMMYRPDRGWGFAHKPGEPASPKEAVAELEELRHRVAEIEARFEVEDRAAQLSKGQHRPAIDAPISPASTAEESVPATDSVAADRRGAQR